MPPGRSDLLRRRRAARPAERAAYLDRGLRRRRRTCAAGSRRCSRPTTQAGSFLEPAPAAADADGTRRRPPTDRRPTADRTSAPGTVDRRPVQAARADRRGRHGRGLAWPSRPSRSSGRSPSSSSRPGWTRRQVLARFEAERQALALMDHPNIAKVLDAGTTDARPAVLRHGAGQGRADHRVLRRAPADARGSGWSCSCRSARRSSTPTRRAIIHRDLKPSNVLVALYDGRPVPEGDRLRRGQGDRASR